MKTPDTIGATLSLHRSARLAAVETTQRVIERWPGDALLDQDAVHFQRSGIAAVAHLIVEDDHVAQSILNPSRIAAKCFRFEVRINLVMCEAITDSQQT